MPTGPIPSYSAQTIARIDFTTFAKVGHVLERRVRRWLLLRRSYYRSADNAHQNQHCEKETFVANGHWTRPRRPKKLGRCRGSTLPLPSPAE
jgi:hypothetical protein